MGRVIDLERQRVETLALDLVPLLQERGSMWVATSEVDNVERWRRAARRAGRLLGWHMRTGLTADGELVWAASEDFSMSEAEQRTAMRRVMAALDYGDAHTPRQR